MLELPEVLNLEKDLAETIIDKRIKKVEVNKSEHKFTFYNIKPEEYSKLLEGKNVTNITQYGFYISIEVEDVELLFRDGVNLRYHKTPITLPEKHQLYIEFEDNTYLTSTVTMYGLIYCAVKGELNQDKYLKIAKENINPTQKEFDYTYFLKLFENCKETISAKAFLATEQRINGIGNGVVQDILYNARIHPKKKLKDINEEEKQELFHSLKDVLDIMIRQGGRDTEKNLNGEYGKYRTVLSKKTVNQPCDICGNIIKKENFLGGSIYYCSECQKL